MHTYIYIQTYICSYIRLGTPEQYRATFRDELQKQQPQKLSAYVRNYVCMLKRMYACMYVCMYVCI